MMESVNLLIVNTSRNAAEEYVSALRNSGMPAHSVCADDAEGIRDMLREQRTDLVLYASEGASVPVADLTMMMREAEADAHLLVLASAQDDDQGISAMREGARGFVDRDNFELIKLVIDREMGDLQRRRQLAEYERRLSEAEERNQALMNTSTDAITYMQDGMHIYANRAYLDLLGFEDNADLEGLSMLDVLSPEDRGKFKKFLKKLARGNGEDAALEVRCHVSDGSSFEASMEFSPARVEGEDCMQVLVSDQSQEKELEERIQFLSNQDPLTGLYNRHYFVKLLDQLLGDETEQEQDKDDNVAALMQIEIDRFAEIQEHSSIESSDRLLVEFAALLRKLSCDSDAVARFGDHSFMLMSTARNIEQIEDLAEQICVKTEDAQLGESTGLPATVSIGVSFRGKRACNAQELVSRAVAARNSAREAGGNQSVLHNPQGTRSGNSEEEIKCVGQIRSALKHDHFRMLFQPIASLKNPGEEYYSVLLRMLDETGQTVSPAQFIPVAQENDLAVRIDRWVIENALQRLVEERGNGKAASLFIELAADTIRSPDLLPWITSLLEDNELPGEKIVFNLGDEGALNWLRETMLFAKGVRALGCRFALDRVGANPDFDKLLKHLPLDFIKIDGNLVQSLATASSGAEQKIRTINQTANGMGIRTIAKSVDDANNLALLWDIGVNYIQGFFIQEPSESLSYEFDLLSG